MRCGPNEELAILSHDREGVRVVHRVDDTGHRVRLVLVGLLDGGKPRILSPEDWIAHARRVVRRRHHRPGRLAASGRERMHRHVHTALHEEHLFIPAATHLINVNIAIAVRIERESRRGSGRVVVVQVGRVRGIECPASVVYQQNSPCCTTRVHQRVYIKSAVVVQVRGNSSCAVGECRADARHWNAAEESAAEVQQQLIPGAAGGAKEQVHEAVAVKVCGHSSVRQSLMQVTVIVVQRALNRVVRERRRGSHALKSADAVVQEQLVRRVHIGDEQIGLAVIIEVGHGDGRALVVPRHRVVVDDRREDAEAIVVQQNVRSNTSARDEHIEVTVVIAVEGHRGRAGFVRTRKGRVLVHRHGREIAC